MYLINFVYKDLLFINVVGHLSFIRELCNFSSFLFFSFFFSWGASATKCDFVALFGAQLKRKTLTNLFIFIAVWIRFKKIQISLPHLWANFIQHSRLILYAALS